MSRIGEKIKAERQKKGMTPKQLGKKCGVNESYILDIETGKKIINEKLLQQLSKILGNNLEESLIQEPKKEEIIEEKKPTYIERTKVRQEVNPVGQWSEALSGIIKEIPILDVNLRDKKGHKSFPIINKKVEGFNPEKLVYIQVHNDTLKGFRIEKGDIVLVYLNQEIVNNSISIVEIDGKYKLRKVKRLSGNKVELIGFNHELKSEVVEQKDIKVIGRGLRVEISL